MAIKPTKFLRKLQIKKRWLNIRLKIKPSEPYKETGKTAAIAIIHQRGSTIMARLTDADEVLLFADNTWVGKAAWKHSSITDCAAVFDSEQETQLVLHLLTQQLRQEISALAEVERQFAAMGGGE